MDTSRIINKLFPNQKLEQKLFNGESTYFTNKIDKLIEEKRYKKLKIVYIILYKSERITEFLSRGYVNNTYYTLATLKKPEVKQGQIILRTIINADIPYMLLCESKEDTSFLIGRNTHITISKNISRCNK